MSISTWAPLITISPLKTRHRDEVENIVSRCDPTWCCHEHSNSLFPFPLKATCGPSWQTDEPMKALSPWFLYRDDVDSHGDRRCSHSKLCSAIKLFLVVLLSSSRALSGTVDNVESVYHIKDHLKEISVTRCHHTQDKKLLTISNQQYRNTIVY